MGCCSGAVSEPGCGQPSAAWMWYVSSPPRGSVFKNSSDTPPSPGDTQTHEGMNNRNDSHFGASCKNVMNFKRCLHCNWGFVPCFIPLTFLLFLSFTLTVAVSNNISSRLLTCSSPVSGVLAVCKLIRRGLTATLVEKGVSVHQGHPRVRQL